MGNLTQTQWISIIIGICSFVGGATGQLTTLFGTNGATYVASAMGLLSGIMAVVLTVTTGQSAQINSVRAIATGPASDIAVSAQTALIQATSAVAQDKAIPKSEEAKNTLVAATIALPEVQTIITDKKTADASPSSSVVASR